VLEILAVPYTVSKTSGITIQQAIIMMGVVIEIVFSLNSALLSE